MAPVLPFWLNVSFWLVVNGCPLMLILCVGIDPVIISSPKEYDTSYPNPAVVPKPTDSCGLK